MADTVNHPAHYNAHPSGVECITVVEHFNFNIGNAIKYLWRAGSKGALLEDLRKAQWYVAREILRVHGEIATEEEIERLHRAVQRDSEFYEVKAVHDGKRQMR